MAITKVTSSLIESGAINAGHVTGLTSAHIAEGSNLYYTDARSRASISVGGSDIAYNSSTGVITGSRPTLAQVLGQGNSTGSNNILVSGSQKIQFNSDLEIYNNGSSSIIKSVTDTLYLNANSLNIADQNNTNGVLDAGFAGTGVLRLKYQGNVKLQTSNTGVTISGTAVTDLLKVNSQLYFGSSSMGRIEQSGSNWIFQTYASGAYGERFRITDTGATVSDDLTVLGDLNITGDINSYNVTDLDVTDKTITLGSGQIEANSGGSGIIVDGSNASILWDESTDVWDFNKGFEAGGKVFFKPASAQTGYALFDDGSNGGIHIKADTSSVTTEYITTGFSAFEEARFVASNFVWKNSGTSTRAEIDSSGNFGVLEGNMLRAYRAGNSAYAALFMDSGEKLYIRNSWAGNQIVMLRTGEVGIGTASPSSQLHVSQGNQALGFDAGVWISANPSNYTVGRGAGITMQNADVYTGGIYGIREESNWKGSLTFYTHTTDSGNTFGTTFTEKMRITSDGKVGIGITNPAAKLNISSASDALLTLQNNIYQGSGQNTESILRFKSGAGTDDERAKGGILFKNDGSAYGRGDLHFLVDSNDDNGNAVLADSKMVISHEGKVGIGTDNPAGHLDIHDSSGDSNLYLSTGNTNANTTLFFNDGANAGRVGYDHANNQLRFFTNGTEIFRMFQLAGAYGVIQAHGTGSDDYPNYTFSGDTDTGMFRAAANVLAFTTASTERMRIDSGGSVYIGSTGDSGSNYHRLSHDGFVRHKRTNQIVAVFDRDGTDGNIIHLRKNGSDIGTIGVQDANNLTIGATSADHPGIKFGTHAILPMEAGVDSNGQIDLGASSAKFKNLWLSNAVYASDILANGSGGLALQTDEGTKRLFIKDNGDVKVGEGAVGSATSAPLHVAKFHTDIQAIFGDNNATIDDPTIRVLGRDSANTSARFSYLGLDADANYGFIGYNAGSGTPGKALSFDTSGNVTVSSGNIQLGASTDYRSVKGVYRKNVTTNKSFNAIFKVNGSALGSNFRFSVVGTINNVVINARYEILVNHSYDCVVSSLSGHYTETKVKVVSNQNEDCTVYLGANTHQGNTISTLNCEVETYNNETIDFDTSNPHTTAHFIHTASAGANTTSTGAMTLGVGTSTAYT